MVKIVKLVITNILIDTHTNTQMQILLFLGPVLEEYHWDTIEDFSNPGTGIQYSQLSNSWDQLLLLWKQAAENELMRAA